MKHAYLAASSAIIEIIEQEKKINESYWKTIYSMLKHLTNATVIYGGMEIEVMINGKTIIRSLEEEKSVS